MNANQFKAAINSMPESDLGEVISAFDRARAHAVQMMLSARLPECAAFGAIAGDLEYSLHIICRCATAQQSTEGINADNAQTSELIASALGPHPKRPGKVPLG